MNLDLQHKTALICGSSQGIGFAIAKELALLGADCILLARNKESLEKAKAQLDHTRGQSHQCFVADFSKNEDVAASVASILEHNVIHILINNTGGPPSGPITSAGIQDFMQAYQLHLLNNHQLAMAVLPGMRASGYGRIINVVSTSVKIPLPNLGVSNTTRAAVSGWAKTLSNEVARDGITVNNVLPGATETQRLQSIMDTKAGKLGVELEEVQHEMRNEIPMRRFGKPEEIAAMAAFLATPAAAYITGQSICVDGGRTGSL
jgi:3-oxoacyl-[acyl-carrier protein] reductase